MATPTTKATTNGGGVVVAQAVLPEVAVDEDQEAQVSATEVEKDDEDEDVREKPSPKHAKTAPAADTTKAARALREEAHSSIKDWLSTIAGEQSIRVHVVRVEPKWQIDPRTGERKKCDGQVARYDRVIDEAEIQDKHGGGTYQLRINTPDSKGVYRYMTAKTIDIAGDPRLDDVPRAFVPPQPQAAAPAPSPSPESSPLVGKMFDQMMQTIRQKPEGNPQASFDQLRVMLEPFKAQIDALTDLLKAKDAEIAQIRETAGKDPFRDSMMSKLLEQDTARLKAQRDQFESEMRMLKEGFRQDEQRLKDAHQRDIDRMERVHEREIKTMKDSLEREIGLLRATNLNTESNSKTVSEVHKTVYEREITRLEGEVKSLRDELTTLRARKDQTTAEKIHEMKALKELVSDDEPGETSMFEKVIGAVGSLPIVQKLAENAAGGAPPQDPGAVQQMPHVRRVSAAQAQRSQRPRMVRNKDTGQVSMVTPDGQMVPVRKKPPTSEGVPNEEAPSYDPAVVKQAVEYMENAYRAQTEAKVFAEGVRPMIPAPILASIRELGIDGFLSKVAQLDGLSPLATQGGRNWVRRVAKILLGEADDE